jgi:hypothetical protein
MGVEMDNAAAVAAKGAVNSNLSNRERVSLALQTYGTQTIRCTIDDLVGKTGLTPMQVYQSLYGMQSSGRLEILTEDRPNSNRKRIVGVVLKRIEAASTILERVPHRVSESNGTKRVTKKSDIRIKDSIPMLVAYMDAKIVVDKCREQLAEAGLNPDQLHFDANPFAEEGIMILQEWIDINKTNAELLIKLETLQREVEVLSGGKKITADELNESDIKSEAKEGAESIPA